MENGKINIFGDYANDGWTLNADQTYFLREVTAPENYKKADYDLRFTIARNGISIIAVVRISEATIAP